jgi:hypothetical protein
MRVHHYLLLTGFGAATAVAPLLTAQQCRADCSSADAVCVCAVDLDPRAVRGPSAIFITRLGSSDREPAQFRSAVQVGDLVESNETGAAMELTCPKGSSVKLAGAFRAVLLPPADGQDCVFSLLSGVVNVVGDQPTEVRSGLVVMGSKRTNYGLATFRRSGQPDAEAWVYEGEALCQASPGGRTLNVGPGEKMLLGEGRWFRATVTSRDIEMGAVLFARLDVARARTATVDTTRTHTALSPPIENVEAAYVALKNTYSAVLRKPADPEPRMELAVQQINLKLPSAALYNMSKVEEQALEKRQRAMVAVIRGFAYQELGEKERAQQLFLQARQIDPEVLEANRLRQYKFAERVVVNK